jgi:hypothetical protein
MEYASNNRNYFFYIGSLHPRKNILNLIKAFEIFKEKTSSDFKDEKHFKNQEAERLEDYISKNNRHTQAQYDASRIRLCVKLIEKVQHEYYNVEYQDYFNSVFRFEDDDEMPGYKRLEIDTLSDTFEEYVIKYYRTYLKVIREHHCDSSLHTAIKMANYNHLKAKRLLFKLLDTHIERWWD